MKLRIRSKNLRIGRTRSKKKLQTVLDETEAETTSRSTAFSDDVASLVGSGVKSLSLSPASHKDHPVRRAPSREPSLETGKGFGGLEKFLKKYDRIVDSNSSLSCDGGEVAACPDERKKTKKSTNSQPALRHSEKKRRDTKSTRSVCASSRDPSARRGTQRHVSTSGNCIKVKIKKQLKKMPSMGRLQDIFKEYDEITSKGGAKSVTGW